MGVKPRLLELQEAQTELLSARDSLRRAHYRCTKYEAEVHSLSEKREESLKRVQQARALLNAHLGEAVSRHIRKGRSPEAIAELAGINLEQLWGMLSGASPADEDWFPTAVISIIAPDMKGPRIVLIDLLRRLETASIEYAHVTDRHCASEADLTNAMRESAMAEGHFAVAERRLLRLEGESKEAEGERRGRHRSVPPVEVVPDVEGHDSKPDPLAVRSEAEFVTLLRRYRAWAGNPGFREMAQQVPDGPSFSTYSNVLRASTAPRKLKTVQAFVKALGGTEEDVRRWATAWRRVTSYADTSAPSEVQDQTREALTMLRGGLDPTGT